MTNRQSWWFAVACTGISALVFVLLTLDSHRQFPELTNAEDITPAVKAGMDVWHDYNCINCHTLFGEGAYYAPDLTKITDQRSDAYLQAYMKDPAQFYDEQKHRRLMPNQNLADQEITDLIAFLEWVSNVDNQGWPPRPIRVTGDALPVADLSEADTEFERAEPPPGTTPVDAGDQASAKGEFVFRTATPSCNSCHSTAPGADMAGPTLAGMGSRAAKIVQSEDYTGSATDAEGYIRESIVEPSAHLVPGAMYSAGGTSFMPPGYEDSLTEEELESLVAFLASLK